MIRTQIYFPREELKELKEYAWAAQSTVSELIRTTMREKINAKKTNTKVIKKRNAGNWLLEMARRAEKMHFQGPKDLSTNMDEYLYGGKK